MRGRSGAPLQRVTPAQPCPVCGHGGWCNRTPTMVHCMRVDAPVVGPWKFLKKAADGGSIYVLADDDFTRRDETWNRPLPTRTPTANELAPVHVRDRWYRQLLRHLTLSDEHLGNLRGRGLSDEVIRARQYRTLPPFQPKERSLLVKKLMDALGEEPAGVPGFFKSRRGLWLLSGAGGILIPVCDRDGRIQGFQIRLDSPGRTWQIRTTPTPETVADGPYQGKTWLVAEAQTEDGEVVKVVATTESMAKQFQRLTVGDQLTAEFSRMADGRYTASKPLRYVWLSSAGRTGGCSPSTPLHVTAPVHGPVRKNIVWVTEGPLKADIACEYERSIFVAVPGVAIRKGVVELLQEIGCENVILAFDMDGRTNPHVQKHTRAMIEMLADAGFRVSVADWDAGYNPDDDSYKYKGIDDAAVARITCSVRSVRRTVAS